MSIQRATADLETLRGAIEARYQGVALAIDRAHQESVQAIQAARDEATAQLAAMAIAQQQARTDGAPLPLRHDAPDDQVAAVIGYEAQRLLGSALGQSVVSAWDDADATSRTAAIVCARAILDGTVQTPEAYHATRQGCYLADGWTYGAAVDPIAKTDPILARWSDLSEPDRLKAQLFVTIARTLVRA